MALPLFVQRNIQRLEDLIQKVDALPSTQDTQIASSAGSWGPMVKASPQLSYQIEQAIIDIAPTSVYVGHVKAVFFASHRASVAKALCDDLKAGYYNSQRDLAHADVFGDMLEMAQHLLDQNYKVASTVIAGSTAESHLRSLSVKHGLPVADATGKPFNGATLNTELYKAGVYDLTTQKLVLAWQGLRNDAAHGVKTEASLDQGQIQGMISGILNFMSNNPA